MYKIIKKQYKTLRMSKDEKTLHIKKLKDYVENLQVINNDIQKEIYYIYSLLKDN